MGITERKRKKSKNKRENKNRDKKSKKMRWMKGGSDRYSTDTNVSVREAIDPLDFELEGKNANLDDAESVISNDRTSIYRDDPLESEFAAYDKPKPKESPDIGAMPNTVWVSVVILAGMGVGTYFLTNSMAKN